MNPNDYYNMNTGPGLNGTYGSAPPAFSSDMPPVQTPFDGVDEGMDPTPFLPSYQPVQFPQAPPFPQMGKPHGFAAVAPWIGVIAGLLHGGPAGAEFANSYTAAFQDHQARQMQEKQDKWKQDVARQQAQMNYTNTVNQQRALADYRRQMVDIAKMKVGKPRGPLVNIEGWGSPFGTGSTGSPMPPVAATMPVQDVQTQTPPNMSTSYATPAGLPVGNAPNTVGPPVGNAPNTPAGAPSMLALQQAGPQTLTQAPPIPDTMFDPTRLYLSAQNNLGLANPYTLGSPEWKSVESGRVTRGGGINDLFALGTDMSLLPGKVKIQRDEIVGGDYTNREKAAKAKTAEGTTQPTIDKAIADARGANSNADYAGSRAKSAAIDTAYEDGLQKLKANRGHLTNEQIREQIANLKQERRNKIATYNNTVAAGIRAKEKAASEKGKAASKAPKLTETEAEKARATKSFVTPYQWQNFSKLGFAPGGQLNESLNFYKSPAGGSVIIADAARPGDYMVNPAATPEHIAAFVKDQELWRRQIFLWVNGKKVDTRVRATAAPAKNPAAKSAQPQAKLPFGTMKGDVFGKSGTTIPPTKVAPRKRGSDYGLTVEKDGSLRPR